MWCGTIDRCAFNRHNAVHGGLRSSRGFYTVLCEQRRREKHRLAPTPIHKRIVLQRSRMQLDATAGAGNPATLPSCHDGKRVCKSRRVGHSGGQVLATSFGLGDKRRLIIPSPPPALPPTIGLAAERPTIAKEPIAQAIEAKAVAIAAREEHVGRPRAICEATLRLVA